MDASESHKTSANFFISAYFRQFSDWYETYFGNSQESPGLPLRNLFGKATSVLPPSFEIWLEAMAHYSMPIKKCLNPRKDFKRTLKIDVEHEKRERIIPTSIEECVNSHNYGGAVCFHF